MTAGARRFVGLFAALRRSWCVETGRHWRSDNPASGQYGVTALVVHDELGGTIVKTDVNGAWHFYNVVDGSRVDFTMSQFDTPIAYDDVSSNREEALQDTSPDQYHLLRQRLKAAEPVPG